MKNGPFSQFPAIIALILALGLLSCRVDNFNPHLSVITFSARPVALAITPSAPSMAPGSALQLTAIGVFSNNTSHKITNATWTSADESLATVSSAGLVTAAPAASGSTIISASTGSVTASTVVTISPVAALSIEPQNASLAPGTSQRFVATAILANATRQDLTALSTWESSSPAVVALPGAGFATATTGTTGTATVSATFSGVTGTAALTSAQVVSLSVAPAKATIARGTTVQFRAQGTLSNMIVQDLTKEVQWTVSPAGTASISGTGLTVGTSAGTAVITASFGSLPASAALQVTEPVLSSIRLSPGSASVPAGTSVQFRALGMFDNGEQQDVTEDVRWVSLDPTIASISTVAGSRGLASTLASGTARIKASLFDIDSDQALLTVSVPTGTTGPFSLTPLNPTVRIGNSLQFTLVRLSPAGGILEDLTFTAMWSSSNSTVAFVSQGQVFALSPGSTVISANTGTSLVSSILTVSSF